MSGWLAEANKLHPLHTKPLQQHRETDDVNVLMFQRLLLPNHTHATTIDAGLQRRGPEVAERMKHNLGDGCLSEVLGSKP